jgi:hypothetical protein
VLEGTAVLDANFLNLHAAFKSAKYIIKSLLMLHAYSVIFSALYALNSSKNRIIRGENIFAINVFFLYCDLDQQSYGIHFIMLYNSCKVLIANGSL